MLTCSRKTWRARRSTMSRACWQFSSRGRTVGSLPTRVMMQCGLSLPTPPAKNMIAAKAAFCVASSVVTEPQSAVTRQHLRHNLLGQQHGGLLHLHCDVICKTRFATRWSSVYQEDTIACFACHASVRQQNCNGCLTGTDRYTTFQQLLQLAEHQLPKNLCCL